MKKLSLILSIGFLSIFTGIMVFSVVHTKAQTTTNPLRVNLCEYQESGPNKNMYNNPELSTEQIMTLYHQQTNNKFNTYIRTMITSQAEAAKNNSVDPKSLPPEPPDEPPAEGEDPMKAFCVDNPDNYSTFCLAARLISDQEAGNGYIQYAQALDCRRGNLFETTQEESLYQGYGEALIIGEENEQNFTGILQAQKVLEVSARLEAIDREIKTSKRALDQTLAAYEELKTAWPMHKRYVEVYEDLVKYRDKMIEVRHQIEEYPSKFIDATTTMCT